MIIKFVFLLPYSLEADKIQIEIELNQLKQKCSVANDDLKEMTTKCHNLEDELMKEKLTNQYGHHYANIPAASKPITKVSQEVGLQINIGTNITETINKYVVVDSFAT